MAFTGKRRRRGAYSSSRKRVRRSGRFRAGTGRKLRYGRFSRRSYTPSALMPESKYVDAGYGSDLTNVNTILPAVGAATLVLDGNGPATTQADQNCGGTGVVGIAGGSGFNQRIGRKLLLKYLSVRLRAQMSTAAILVNLLQQVRIMLLYDRQPNLALPQIGDIMNVNPGMTVLTFQEDKNRDRFVRLWDHTIVLSAADASSFTEASQCVVTKNIKIGGVQIYNDTANGGVANIQTGSLVWAFLWDGATGNDCIPIEMVTRLRYADY